MNHNFLLALLAKLELISPARAEELAKKLNNTIAPARYKEAAEVIDEIFKEVP